MTNTALFCGSVKKRAHMQVIFHSVQQQHFGISSEDT